MFDVYFQERAFNKAREHFGGNAEKGLEAIGFLVGEVFSFKGKKYVIVRDYLTAENDATAVSVSFSRPAFKEISKRLAEENSGVIVGWCHSHPGYGCFLSDTDVNTQKFFFPEEFHVAVVCDPLKGEWSAFKVNGGGYAPVPLAVIRPKERS